MRTVDSPAVNGPVATMAVGSFSTKRSRNPWAGWRRLSRTTVPPLSTPTIPRPNQSVAPADCWAYADEASVNVASTAMARMWPPGGVPSRQYRPCMEGERAQLDAEPFRSVQPCYRGLLVHPAHAGARCSGSGRLLFL